MGNRLIAGREFSWTDLYNQTPVALVSENAARTMWQSPQSAIGKRIRAGMKDDWREVIGVLADERSDGVDQRAPTTIYWPLMPRNFQGQTVRVIRSLAFVLRTPRAGSTLLQPELRHAVWSVNPNLPLSDVRTLQSVYDQSLSRTSFTLLMLAIAGAMALLLGVVGIYGVISYSVSQRTREIGIRLALGAPPPDVTRMFVRHGLVLSAAGGALGLAAALGFARLMRALLFDVSPADPPTYLAVLSVLILAAALASYLPARRAASVDPADALRAE
jgi:hypothetical protein